MSVNRNVRLAVAIAADGRPKYQIAAAAGIHPNDLSGIVNGRAQPTERARAGIAAALGVAETELFDAQPSTP